MFGYQSCITSWSRELLEAFSRRYNARSSRDYFKPQPRSQLESTSKSLLGSASGENNPTSTTESKPKWEDKLATLRAQRRAQGLCMKCGEKWACNHRCPRQEPIHILEEFMEVINMEEDTQVDGEIATDTGDEELLSLSLAMFKIAG